MRRRGDSEILALEMLALGSDDPEDGVGAVVAASGVGVAVDRIYRIFIGNDGKLRPIVRAPIMSRQWRGLSAHA
jgi:hypothetical protein